MVKEIKHYQLKNILIKLENTYKISEIILINFISSKDNDEERVMHSKSDEVKMMINGKEGEVMEELFQSFPSIYQIGLEISKKNNEFLFACVH